MVFKPRARFFSVMYNNGVRAILTRTDLVIIDKWIGKNKYKILGSFTFHCSGKKRIKVPQSIRN